MRAAWTGRPIQLAGRDFEARDNVMLPAPVAGSSVPIWIGGNSRRAMRRAVEVGDGWVPFPTSPGTCGALRTGRIESLDDLKSAYRRAEEDGTRSGSGQGTRHLFRAVRPEHDGRWILDGDGVPRSRGLAEGPRSDLAHGYIARAVQGRAAARDRALRFRDHSRPQGFGNP